MNPLPIEYFGLQNDGRIQDDGPDYHCIQPAYNYATMTASPMIKTSRHDSGCAFGSHLYMKIPVKCNSKIFDFIHSSLLSGTKCEYAKKLTTK